MKDSSTTTTVSGSAHHESVRRCAAAIGGRASPMIAALPLRRYAVHGSSLA